MKVFEHTTDVARDIALEYCRSIGVVWVARDTAEEMAESAGLEVVSLDPPEMVVRRPSQGVFL